MAFGITELINNIQDSINGLLNGGNGAPSYHYGDSSYDLIQSTVNPQNWMKLSFPYTFSVINLKDPNLDGGFDDFALPLAPGAISQKEPPAISIRPTQGGTTVNHNGVGYKELSISGTTGVAPFRGEGGVDRKTGEGIFQPKQLKYKSGYEVFIHLRNWFRTYYEFKKKKGKAARDYRLVWRNYKDGEFLIVELMSFEMERNASRPFMYDYKLEFKVLANFEFTAPDKAQGPLSKLEDALQDALDKINFARGVMLRSQGILRQIESTYAATVLEPLRQATLAIKAALGVAVTAADISTRTVINTVSSAKALLITASEAAKFASLGLLGQSQTLAEIQGLVDKRIGTLKKTLDITNQSITQGGSGGLASMGALLMQTDVGNFPQKTLDVTSDEQTNSANLPRLFYENSVAELQRVKQNAEDFFNLGSPDYDALFDRTATLSADITSVVTDDQYDILGAFNTAIIALYMTMTAVDLFKTDFDARINDMNARFNDDIQLLVNQSVRQMQYPGGTTLERLAAQELGDSARWGEIVEANDLKPPFVSEDPNEARDGVIGAGQIILIPQPVVNGFSQAPQGKLNRLTTGMSEVERSFGTDLKVTKDFDLSLTNSNDFDIVAGGDNLTQATILKFFYEPGEVIRHPTIGAGLLPGRKVPPISAVKDGIVNSLMQDSRVQKIDNLFLQRENGTIFLTFDLIAKQVDLPIRVKIKLPQ